MVISYKQNALHGDDLSFLKEYITGNTKYLYNMFPVYSFLPKDEPAENHIERILRAITPGKEHIEYWFRWNEAGPWHVDGDEILFKQKKIITPLDYNAEDPNSSRVARTTHVLYLFIQNIIGGELQICTSHPWEGKHILDNKWEPPNGANITTIRPFENMAVKFPSNFYHRVKDFVPKFEGLEMKRLALVWSIWDHHPEGYKDHKYWKLTKEFGFAPAKGWRDFTYVKEWLDNTKGRLKLL